MNSNYQIRLGHESKWGDEYFFDVGKKNKATAIKKTQFECERFLGLVIGGVAQRPLMRSLTLQPRAWANASRAGMDGTLFPPSMKAIKTTDNPLLEAKPSWVKLRLDLWALRLRPMVWAVLFMGKE